MTGLQQKSNRQKMAADNRWHSQIHTNLYGCSQLSLEFFWLLHFFGGRAILNKKHFFWQKFELFQSWAFRWYASVIVSQKGGLFDIFVYIFLRMQVLKFSNSLRCEQKLTCRKFYLNWNLPPNVIFNFFLF